MSSKPSPRAGIRLFQVRAVHSEAFGTGLRPLAREGGLATPGSAEQTQSGANAEEAAPREQPGHVTCLTEERSILLPGGSAAVSMAASTNEAYVVTEKGAVVRVGLQGFKALRFR